ncbi:uncharacterized protein LOC124387444 [Silurus meridionalis]|uniref:uncharacterized protein LOC124387444 n=1 Tax=Silurus meridionalis TaxID=175797 RepID=UPI001EEB423E|nr:uncharacterized protein LOC124387444 [Silurus meridionalis]
MFSTSQSVLLVLLVITCFHYYAECDDELMADFCLNTDTPVYMDSSTVQSQEILTTFFILATTNPDPQDHTEHLHTVQSTRGSGVNEAAGLCCFKFHKPSIPAADVVSVEQTRSDCTLPGVILTTKKGSRMCVDPEVDWVKQIISQTEIKEKIIQFSVTDANGAVLCCFKFHTSPIPAANIVSVAKTRYDCTLPGVILTTKTGSRMCVDPEDNLVKQIISKSEIKEKIMTLNVTAGNGATLCCFEFHKRPIPAANIVSVEKRDLTAHFLESFLQQKRDSICADPEVDWVKEIIKNKRK